MNQPPPSPDTPERWGAASRGYAGHVATRLMDSFMESFVRERYDGGPVELTNVATVGSGVAS